MVLAFAAAITETPDSTINAIAAGPFRYLVMSSIITPLKETLVHARHAPAALTLSNLSLGTERFLPAHPDPVAWGSG